VGGNRVGMERKPCRARSGGRVGGNCVRMWGMHTPARVAVEELVASANAADAASTAVKWLLCHVIVEKVAHAAKVLSKFGPAALPDAQVGHGLPQLALVAHHLCDCMPAARTHTKVAEMRCS